MTTLVALRIAESFIAEELGCRRASYEPRPTPQESADIADAAPALTAVREAIRSSISDELGAG